MLVLSVFDGVLFSTGGRKGRVDCAVGELLKKEIYLCQSKVCWGGVQLWVEVTSWMRHPLRETDMRSITPKVLSQQAVVQA